MQRNIAMISIQTLGRAAAIAAAATLVIGSPVAAFAKPIPAARPAKPAPAATNAPRYCVTEEIGGSRFTRRTCKTRDAWINDENFDPVTFRELMTK
jgi:hypothetical protein